MSPKSKAMSPNFISGRNIKQAGKCSKGSLFREWINSEINIRQRKLGSFASSKKRGAHIVFLQHSTLTRHLNLADHKLVILATSVSKRTWIYARKKKHHKVRWCYWIVLTAWFQNTYPCLNSNYWSFWWSREHFPSFLCLSIVSFSIPFNIYLHFVNNVRFAVTNLLSYKLG